MFWQVFLYRVLTGSIQEGIPKSEHGKMREGVQSDRGFCGPRAEMGGVRFGIY